MPPCYDVYVWVEAADRADALARFVDRYVDADSPGDPRFAAFVRVFIQGEPRDGDLDALADLPRHRAGSGAFSLYLHAKAHHEAIITVTEEGHLVLGLGLDDPEGDPTTDDRAAALMGRLIEEFGATGGVAGVELAPPQSASEWLDDGLVMQRAGAAPPH